MKVYEGGRSLDGAVVTVDGAPLDPRFDVHRFSRMGFEWTYEGDGPRQLARSLIAPGNADQHADFVGIFFKRPIERGDGGLELVQGTKRLAAKAVEIEGNRVRISNPAQLAQCMLGHVQLEVPAGRFELSLAISLCVGHAT